VSDLADAHLLALDHLRAGRGSEQINLGNGKGASVLEVARRVTGRQIPSRFMGARAGRRIPGTDCSGMATGPAGPRHHRGVGPELAPGAP